MTEITQLNGIRLNNLQVKPNLTGTTKFLVQDGTEKSKAATIDILENYLDITNKISYSMSTHLLDSDPHGDRAYTVAQINLHKSELDPHGHKAYTNNTLTLHLQSLDPHGDRSYALDLMNQHNALLDPHGYKAFVDSQILTHDQDVDSHDITNRILQGIEDIRGVTDGFAPLDNDAKIPQSYLPVNNDKISFVFSLPAIGVASKLYINYADDKQYYWNGTEFKLLSSFNIDGENITTDDVEESSTDLDRRYFTSVRETSINNAINNRINTGVNLGTGFPVYKEKVGSSLNFRTLVAGDGIEIVQTSNTLTINKIADSVIEDEPIEFSIQTRTDVGVLSSYLTTDGLILDVSKSNTLKYPTDGLTAYDGRVIVAKIKQGSGLSALGKYNRIEEMRSWDVKLLINSYTEWDALDDPITISNIASLTITEDNINGLTTTSPTLTITIDNDTKSVLVEGTSPSDLNYAYLWKATFKKTYLEYLETGTIEHD